ncbi:hypothetical protein ACIQU3_21475 [Streptomyces sp. NPDC101110]|uniref:hypothetical protein n=1 Tax=unclassified Streptomyces TaxID=2593676 RepID=UPI00382D0C0E
MIGAHMQGTPTRPRPTAELYQTAVWSLVGFTSGMTLMVGVLVGSAHVWPLPLLVGGTLVGAVLVTYSFRA